MKFSIKRFLIVALTLLLVLGAAVLGKWQRVLVAFGMIVVASAVDLLWTFWKKRKWYIPESSIISALIIALVFDTLTHPSLALGAAALASLSKQALHFGRVRHIVNPAALAMVVISFFVPVVAWWGVSWGFVPLLVVALMGVYSLYRIRRFPMVLAFLVVYLGLLLLDGVSPQLMFFDGTLLFFATVMLVEPITTAYALPRQRMLYGVLVAALAVLFSVIPRFWPLRDMDTLLFALVVGNLIMSVRLVPKINAKPLSPKP